MNTDFIVGVLEPGKFVRCPSSPNWGVGQIQSVIGERLTVNFENVGKQTLKLGHIDIELVPDHLMPAP